MGARQLLTLPLSQIDCEPQVRELKEAGLGGLAQTLATVGLQHPILVRAAGERWVIVDGERRFRAAQRAGWESIDALVDDEPAGAPGRIVRQLVANCQREGLTPIETARAIELLMAETPCTAAEAAAKLGFSAARVCKLLSLLTLPKEMQDHVHGGRLAPSTAYEIAKTKNPERRAELIAEASGGGLRRDVAARQSRKASKAHAKSRHGVTSRRFVIPTGEGGSVVVTGLGLDLALLIETLERATARVRAIDADAAAKDLAAAVGALSGRGSKPSRPQDGARSRRTALEPTAAAAGES